MTLFISQPWPVLVPVVDVGAERHAAVAVAAGRVVVEADLQRDQAVGAEVEGLGDLALGEVPEVELLAVAAGLDVLQLEAGVVGVGGAELAGDHHVVAGLVPEVVVVLHLAEAGFPAAGDVEVLVHGQEAAGALALGVAEHRDDDLLAEAVDGVGRGQAGLGDDLLGLDHLVELGRARVGGVEDVDAAGFEAGDDQEAALGRGVAVAGAARVPAEVVQLVAVVGHLQAVHDLGVGRARRVDVDRRHVVGCLDRRAGVEADGVEQLLARRRHRGLGRGVAGPAAVLGMSVAVRGHDGAPSLCRATL
jgi:hypothetical protein